MTGEPPWRGYISDYFHQSIEGRTPSAPPTPDRLVSGALWYACEVGIPVFPLMPGTKVPYPRTNGVHDATTDPEVITNWWWHHPESNIGMATGHGVDVFDFDGPVSHAAWTERFPEAVVWADTDLYVLAAVHTPRKGGLHLWVDSTGMGNRAGLVEGVDYRGLGGYVVVPPSHTPQGRYVFVVPPDPAMIGAKVPPPPTPLGPAKALVDS